MKRDFKIIGVMSGTSLDGIDLVYVNFKFDKIWSFEIIYSETVDYDAKWVDILKSLVSCSLDDLKKIDFQYTNYLALKINAFIKSYNIKNINAVCSHGHTALHQPEKKLTYQIGNMPHLSDLIQQTVVCDFRVQDVKLGGQGAPLVPIGDALLFSEYDFCLNLGGFANISTHKDNERIAYDICPVNIVLNNYAKQLGFDFDAAGNIASSGTVNEELLKKLNSLPFYKKMYPKSLGLEWVDINVFPLINSYKLEIKDVLCTFVEHIAMQLSIEINKKNKASVLITGGGVYNNSVIKRLKSYTSNQIILPSKSIIDFKEALIFGFLGMLKLCNEVNCLKSVTGASKNHSSGEIFIFKK